MTREIWESSDRDWSEDFSHENGNYFNNCIECKQQFKGHKRRVICKKCSTPDWEELSKRKRPEDTKDNKAWAGAWLEGEMVGYARCMIEKVKPLESKLSSLREQLKAADEVMIFVEAAVSPEIIQNQSYFVERANDALEKYNLLKSPKT